VQLRDLPDFELRDVSGVPAATIKRGLAYAQEGRVSAISVGASGKTVMARVRGSEPNPYDVTVYFSEAASRRVRITGSCACPVGVNCKHVVAVLATVSLLRANETGPSDTTASRDDRADSPAARWIERVREAMPPAEREPSTGDERVVYVIGGPSQRMYDRLPIEIQVVRFAKTRRWNRIREMSSDTLMVSNARAITEDDRILAGLMHFYEFGPRSADDVLATLLRRMLGTGRAYLETLDDPPLALGTTRTAHLTWRVGDNGSHSAAITFDEPDTALMARDIHWYVDRTMHVAGPIDAGVTSTVLRAFLGAPTFTASDVDEARELFARTIANVPAAGTPAVMPTTTPTTKLAPIVQAEPMIRVEPVPVLTLRSIAVPADRRSTSGPIVDLAELRFRYGDTFLDPDSRASTVRVKEGGKHLQYERARKSESALRKKLASYGLSEDAVAKHALDAPHAVLRLNERPGAFWSKFLHVHVPALRAEGWMIDVDASFRPSVTDLADDTLWNADVRETDGGWFDIAIDLDINGKRTDLLPILRDLARRGTEFDQLLTALDKIPTFYLRENDGSALAFPAARLKAILTTLVELGDPDAAGDGPLRFPRARAGIVRELETATALRWDAPKRIRELGERLETFTHLKRVAVPGKFRGTLRDYQRDGLDWLQFLAQNELGGILADDMGLGKSVQTLAHLLREKTDGRLTQPALLVVPTSLVYNWCDEAERFAPSLRVLALHGPARAERFAEIGDHDLVITTYALLVRDAIHRERTWHAVIFDEAQALKNPLAKAAQAAMALRSSHRLCLTGTPVENSLGDLWSLLSIALPGALGERKAFGRVFRMPIEKHDDTRVSRVLAERIRPFVLRRTKEAVAKELPEKTEIVQRVELVGTQRDLYETIRLAVVERVHDEIAKNGITRSQIVILDALLKLRQVCCDPRLLPERMRKNAESAKLDMLLEMLPQLVAEGRHILLFSQFTSMLDLIAPELTAREIPFVTLTGQTKDRKSAVTAFQNGTVPVFLISLKAGGTGLNLTAADTVIHYDPWWNPAVERQATDRAHRIGQKHHVFVYKLTCAGTVEEKIVALQTRKAELAAAIYAGDGASGARFAAEDVARFFAPLGT
jgi:superfamily II DNA or RNA helicase